MHSLLIYIKSHSGNKAWDNNTQISNIMEHHQGAVKLIGTWKVLITRKIKKIRTSSH